MPKTARVGDQTSHGGAILTGSDTRKVNGQKVARVGDQVSCPTHGNNTIVAGSPNVKCDGQAVARLGDATACGATITTGSDDVITN